MKIKPCHCKDLCLEHHAKSKKTQHPPDFYTLVLLSSPHLLYLPSSSWFPKYESKLIKILGLKYKLWAFYLFFSPVYIVWRAHSVIISWWKMTCITRIRKDRPCVLCMWNVKWLYVHLILSSIFETGTPQSTCTVLEHYMYVGVHLLNGWWSYNTYHFFTTSPFWFLFNNYNISSCVGKFEIHSNSVRG